MIKFSETDFFAIIRPKMSENRIAYKKFIDEEIEVGFDKPPLFSKDPPCPNHFTWRKNRYQITGLRLAWSDFDRHGRMERNMQPKHDARARLKGSWGVGRFHFQVKTEGGGHFEIYYDRSPSNASDRTGHWFLLAELHSDRSD
jgi:hypothetical protein